MYECARERLICTVHLLQPSLFNFFFYALVISKIIFNEILVILEEQFIVNRTDYEVEQRNRKNKRQYILKLKEKKKISVKLNWVEESLS